jgi:hypothetical protein
MDFNTDKKEKENVVLFDASSTRNMDRKIFGFWKAELAKLFGKLKKGGSLIMIENGKLTAMDSLTCTLITPFGSYDFYAFLKRIPWKGYLKIKNRKLWATSVA